MSTERTDPMAAHRAAQQIRDQLPSDLAGDGVVTCYECKAEIELDDDSERIVEAVAGQFTVSFERRVNEHGVAVRRVVLRGLEEVDPNPPADLLAQVRESRAVRALEPIPA